MQNIPCYYWNKFSPQQENNENRWAYDSYGIKTTKSDSGTTRKNN